MVDRLCKVCRFPKWIWGLETKFYWHAVDLKNLYKTHTLRTATACTGCQLLKTALDLAGPQKSGEPIHSIYISGIDGRLRITVEHDTTRRVDIFTLPDKPSVTSIRIAPLSRSSQLEDNVGIIKSWIMKCEESHSKCTYTSTFLPKRLLKFGTNGTIRLLERTALDADLEASLTLPRYACVSHCWGFTRSSHITYRHNLLENLRGILIADLPLTFQHAIAISQALGIEYIWIDSLCIVQDDTDDWDAHVNVMSEIYHNSHITLAAGDSVDDDGGFFFEPELKFTEIRTLSITGKDIVPIEVHLRLLPLHPENMSSDPSTSPLEHRGWIFQERFLSRRFLCFKKNEVQWECLCDVACTCSSIDGNFNAQEPPGEDAPAFPDCHPVKWKLARLQGMERDNILALWQEMIGIYSKKSLSFEKDKVPALAGLAKDFEEAIGDEYIYGHWRKDLEYGLMWERGGDKSKPGRPQRDVPSWSWASAADDDLIFWSKSTTWRGATFKIVDVQGKHLSVSGFVSAIHLEVNNDKSTYIGDVEPKLRRWCYVSQLLDLTQHDKRHWKRLIKAAKGLVASLKSPLAPKWKPYASFAADYRFWANNGELQEGLNEVYFLDLTGHSELEVEKKGEIGRASGMILRKRKTGDFERIGMLSFFDTFNNFHPPPEIFWYPTGTLQTIVIV